MKTMRCFLNTLLTGTIVLVCFAYGKCTEFKIGAAEVVITPPQGTPMGGYFSPRDVNEVHDDLFAKAVVLEAGDVKVAIVVCDLLYLPELYVEKVRKIIKNELRINPENIMIGATHSHTGPVVLREPADQSSSRDADLNTERGRILKRYLEELPYKIAESISKADMNLQRARLSFAKSQEWDISFNRRYFMTDGSVGWNPGINNPKVIKPTGPIDPDVLILYAESLQKEEPIVTFVNFALHLDEVGGDAVSADFPFALSKILKSVKGTDMVTIFSQGCSGEINHYDVNWKRSDDPKYKNPQSGIIKAKENGGILAGHVIREYERMIELEIDKIKIKNEIIQLPTPRFTEDELTRANEIIKQHEINNSGAFLDYVDAYKVRDLYPLKGQSRPVEISVFALGEDCAVVGLPFEVFTELGMYIKNRSPYKYTIIQELTNGSNGYLPDIKGYMEGNYEPVASKVTPGSGEFLVKNVIRMLFELKIN